MPSESVSPKELQNEAPAPKAVALHPAILKRYEEQLLRLESALGRAVGAGDAEAADAIRDLVETVTVFRDAARPGGVAVENSCPRPRCRSEPGKSSEQPET